MAKRIADKELTDRNWDQEDEGEEAGTFSIASDDVMKNRAIKKAKRRAAGEGDSAGAFKGFKGFSLMASGTSGGGAATGFSGFGNGTGFKGLASLSNGNATSSPSFGGFSSSAVTAGGATTAAATTGLTFNSPASTTQPTTDGFTKQINGSAPVSTQSLGTLGSGISGASALGNNKEYSRQLTALNCSVRDWIVKHVNDNPLCDLNPIFKDYEQHLASIERKYGAADGAPQSGVPGEKRGTTTAAAAPPSFSSPSSAKATAAVAPPAAHQKPSAALFSFNKEAGGSGQDGSGPQPAGVTFNFGQKVDSSALGSGDATAAPPGLSFSAASSATGMFGPPAPFSFAGTTAEAVQPTDENGDEESEEPPKPEVREIKEKDAFYSKRCKLFYKKDSEFKEKGVGTLHLKPTPEGRTQLVVRADTNLGNILLNIILQASMPCSRMGKNNVMVVCVPNPPLDAKSPASPVPMLIRVKTAQDADELHKILEEKKA